MASVNETVLSGRYRLESKLGSGGMSTVYLAQDEVLDRPVAVKLLHREISEEADQLERFRREARAAARLSHPNLVSVIDAGEDEGRPYIVFEYVPGETLKQRIQASGPLPVDEAVAYAIEIGRGLIAAHGRKLVHRDVKPQNVLIDPDGRAKVTDFGIARSLESQGLTATGRVLGTTDYVSPEQAMGEDVDERSDVYSLGIVLYEMLVGDVPFQAETQVGVAMKHVNEPLPDVQVERPDVSAAVASVIDRSTDQGPARPLQLGRRDGPRPRGDAGGRGRPRRGHDRRGDDRARLGAALEAPARRRPADLGRRHRDGARRRRPDRRGADLRRRPPGEPRRRGRRAAAAVQLSEDAAAEFDPRRRRQGDRHGAGSRSTATRPARPGRPSTTTPRTSAASRTASA